MRRHGHAPTDATPRRCLLIAAALYFLTIQVWMSWTIWQREGNMPPEPDDSYSYITGIHLLARYGTPLPRLPGLPREHALNIGIPHLSYNTALAVVARLTGATAAAVYFASFFGGKLALLGALLFLFARLGLRANEQAASLALLGGYAGDPATHGFYWVVPSFWLLVGFLVVAGILLSKPPRTRRGLATGFAAGAILQGIHPLSIWAAAVLLLFVALGAWASGEWRSYLSSRRRILTGLAAGVAAMASVLVLLPAVLDWGGPSPPLRTHLTTTFAAAHPPIVPPGTVWQRLTPTLPSAWLIWTTYLRFLIAQPYVLVVGWGVVELWRQRRSALALLWIATVLGVLASARHPLGARTVLFAWPLTLPLLAVGFLAPAERLIARFPSLRPAVTIALVVATLAASAATLVYYLPTVHGVARAVDETWDPGCARQLLEMTDGSSLIEYSDKYALGAFRVNGLLERRWGPVQEHLADPKGRYFFVDSPLAVLTRQHIERALGRPLLVVRRCGFFTILSPER